MASLPPVQVGNREPTLPSPFVGEWRDGGIGALGGGTLCGS